jgi:hypothetical protein
MRRGGTITVVLLLYFDSSLYFAFALLLLSHSASAIAERLRSDFTALAKRFHSVCGAIAQ